MVKEKKGGRSSIKRYPAVCTKCKKRCDVPFKPARGKDVFCDSCFRKRKGQRFKNKAPNRDRRE